MNERKRISLLTVIFLSVTISVVGTTIYVLYDTAFKEQSRRLEETAKSQARLIEAVARFEIAHQNSRHPHAEDPINSTLSQITDAHRNYHGFGKTGEFTLARLEGNNIVFLIDYRHSEPNLSKKILRDSKLAEPMRSAVSGKSGTMIGLDYRGKRVLAAYEPVAVVNYGIVAKIDLEEIRAPFIKASTIAGCITLLVVLVGIWFFRRIGKGVLQEIDIHTIKLSEKDRQLQTEIKGREQAEKELYRLFNLSVDLLTITGFNGFCKQVNPAWTKMLGWTKQELLTTPVLEIVHPQDHERTIDANRQLKSGNPLKDFENRLRCKDGSHRWISWSSFPLPGEELIFSVGRDITADRKAKEDLMENEAQLKAIFQAAENVSFIITDAHDPDPLVLEFSPGAEKIFGYDRMEMIGNPVSALHIPEDIKKFPEIHKLMREGRKGFNGETTLVRKSGETFPAIFSTYPLLDKSGFMYAALSVSIDISEQKRLHQALLENEKKYRQLVEYAPAGIFELDFTTGKFVSANEVICEYTGYTKEEFFQLNPFDLLAESSLNDIMERHQKILDRKPVPNSVECKIKTKNGKEFWVLLNSRFMIENGNTTKASVIVYDITERKKTQEALKTSEEKYRYLVENIDDVIFTMDMQGVITYISPVIETIAGYHPSEGIGKHFKDFIFQEDLEFVSEEFKELTFGVKRPIEYRIISKSGDPLWIKSSSNLVFQGEKPVGIQGILSNISSLKKTEKEKKDMEKQLVQAQKMEAIGRLTGGIAHDFNNLLTAINGNAYIALMQIDDKSPLYEDIKEIQKAGKKAAVLIRQLLAFSRKQIVSPKVMDLNEILDDFEKMLHRLVGEDIILETHKADSLYSVKVDPGQMEQVIMNLVVNAKDAMPQGGKLLIQTQNACLDETFFQDHGINKYPGQYAMLSVADTGCGMDEEIQSHIFEPFFTTKEKDEGTGLGLSTVYGIVKQNNGFVWVYSEPGMGTTFKIYLPVVEGKTESMEKEKPSKSDPMGSETILVVEDEASVRKLAGKILKKYGYKVLCAENGAEALRIVEEYNDPIHLILTDIVMPEMNGKELAERIKAMRPSIHIIYMSGYSKNSNGHTLLLDRNFPILEKPFVPKNLLSKFREVLDGSKKTYNGRKSTRAESDF